MKIRFFSDKNDNDIKFQNFKKYIFGTAFIFPLDSFNLIINYDSNKMK